MFDTAKSKFKLLVIGCVSLCLTVFSFASAAEVIFAQDLPVVQSIKPYPYQLGVESVLVNYGYTTGQKTVFKEGVVGSPEYMFIDSIGARLSLMEGSKVEQKWYSRDFGASYIELNKDSSENPVDILVYAKKSWMSVPVPENLNISDTVSILYEKGLRSEFTVISKRRINDNDTFVPSSTGKRNIVLIINDSSEQTNYIYTLEFNRNI